MRQFILTVSEEIWHGLNEGVPKKREHSGHSVTSSIKMTAMTLHLLALETSSSICDVGVLSCVDGTSRIYTASNDETGKHAEYLLPMVDQVLAQAGLSRGDLDAIAFGQGPGGFTGLRVASGVAQGMAFGLDVPVIPVASLLAVAIRAAQSLGFAAYDADAYFLVVQDARMGEVYLAVYQPPRVANQAWRVVQSPILLDATHVQGWLRQQAAAWGIRSAQPVYIAGDALDEHPALAGIEHQHGRVQHAGVWRADAATVAGIARSAWLRGEALAPEHAVPLYVRDKVAFTTSERQAGAGGNPRAQAPVMTIHPMTDEHLDAVAAIEARVQSFPWTRQNFADGLSAGYPGWVACQNGQVTGFYMVMMAPDVAHLLVIAVDPNFQRQGTGTLLVEHCQRQADAMGLDTLVLEVRVSNHAAINFYRQQGFEAFTARTEYYPAGQGKREDASVMKKRWQLTKVPA